MKHFVRVIIAASSLLGIALFSFCGGSGGSRRPAPLVITTASLPNGSSLAPYNQTIQASGGVGPYTWTVDAGQLPHNLALSASSSSSVSISGTPDTAAQDVAFTIKVTDSSGKSASQAYSISILLEPDTLTLSSPDLRFSTQLVGTASAAQTETLTNTGTESLVIADISIAGPNDADFVQTTTCGPSLAANASCTISVVFTPGVTGPRSAAVNITDNSTGSPHSFPMDGTGVTSGPNATLSADTLTFAAVIGTTSSPQTLTLSNYGTAVLSLASITATAGFAETHDCTASLTPGGSCAIAVTFTAAAAGDVTGTLAVADNAAASPHSVALTGSGLASGSGAGFCVVSSLHILTGACLVHNPGLPIGRCSSISSTPACVAGLASTNRTPTSCTNLPPAVVDTSKPCP